MIDRKHRISHLDSVYAREAERSGDLFPTSDTQVFARAKTCIKIIESSRVYRKGASLNRVPDTITLRDSINLLKMQCMHAQRSESGFTPHERYTSFCPSKNLH